MCVVASGEEDGSEKGEKKHFLSLDILWSF